MQTWTEPNGENLKSDFSKVSMGSAMKALKGESKCGDAVCDVLKYLKTQTEIPH